MKGRYSKYLHMPMQIVWFDFHEVMCMVVFYLLAMLFGGGFWVLLFIGPAVLIRIKRAHGRGFFGHWIYYLGYARLDGYPHPTQNRFYE